MKRDPRLEPELEALLKLRKIERRAPPEVRARALARGRAIIAAGGQIPPASPPEVAAPPVMHLAAWGRLALAASVAVAVAIGAVAAVAAFRHPVSQSAPVAAPSALASAPIDAPVAQEAPAGPPAVAPLPSASAESTRVTRAGGDGDPSTTELGLLAGAQAAYTHRDFARALALIAEHARRFPNGHLAEEREALRVRSLLGSGRTDEAHRAATAFALRFPRSVLLPESRDQKRPSNALTK